jgi:hypothetical protein
MTQAAGDLGLFSKLIKDYVLYPENFTQLETALCELSKCDTILTNENDRLCLVRDILHLAKYLSTLNYEKENDNDKRMVIEIYGRSAIGFVMSLVKISFDVSELTTEELTTYQIRIGTENRYPVTALASFLWRFTFAGWDEDFGVWYANEIENKRVDDVKPNLLSDPRYAEDFKINRTN